MFVGALLDGMPEAFILGSTIALGGGISIAFVAAVFVSNIPQGVAGTTSLQDAGYSAGGSSGCGPRSPSPARLVAVLGYSLSTPWAAAASTRRRSPAARC